MDTRLNHVSPRVGLAWTPYPNGHTVIHAAAGLFYGSIGGNLFTYPSNGEPFSGRPTFTNVIHVSNPYATDPKDFCNGDPTCIAGGVGHSPFPFIYNPKNPKYFVTPAAIIPVDPNFRWPVSYQVNFGFEQQLGAGFAFSGSYVGAFSRKLPTEWDVNYPQFNVSSTGAPAASCTDTTQACAYADTSATVNNRRPYNAKTYAATSTSSAVEPDLLDDLADSIVGERELQLSAGDRFRSGSRADSARRASMSGRSRCRVSTWTRPATPATARQRSQRTIATTGSTGSARTMTSATSWPRRSCGSRTTTSATVRSGSS